MHWRSFRGRARSAFPHLRTAPAENDGLRRVRRLADLDSGHRKLRLFQLPHSAALPGAPGRRDSVAALSSELARTPSTSSDAVVAQRHGHALGADTAGIVHRSLAEV